MATALLRRPLPWAEPDRLMAVFEWNQPRDRPTNVANPGNLRAWREEISFFRSMSAVSPQLRADAGEPVEGEGVLGHCFWMQRFGGDPSVVETRPTPAGGTPLAGDLPEPTPWSLLLLPPDRRLRAEESDGPDLGASVGGPGRGRRGQRGAGLACIPRRSLPGSEVGVSPFRDAFGPSIQNA